MNQNNKNQQSDKMNQTLEFTKIVTRLSELAVSQKAKEKAMGLHPFFKESECRAKIKETTEAVKLMEGIGTPPVAIMEDLDKNLILAEKGAMLIPKQLTLITGFLMSCRRMKKYLKKAETMNTDIAGYGGSFYELAELTEAIEKAIRNNEVEDSASTYLRDIRRRAEGVKEAMKAKLESILRSKKEYFADGYVVTRNGRFVLPVKKEYKNQIGGTVIDTSGTGSTYFIEPTPVRKLQEELLQLEIEEDNEIRKILYTLTTLVDERVTEIRINKECMETLDFVFAKGKLSLEMKAIGVQITTERRIEIIQGRHPLLNEKTCVPLDFAIGGDIKGIVITGPNTGGKTVSLKTVGLLSLMAQSGLHVPAAKGSVFSMHSNVLCDIGDGQSITENLSTFSAHITNIIHILEQVTEESLVLLDELGSGTDPTEGMGIAVSILEELRKRGCLFVATTHYPEIKDFAMETEGLLNARMEFDREGLQPLYKLQIGEIGESCALYIARRLGFPEHMLKRAHQEAYGKNQKTVESKQIPPMEFHNTRPKEVIKTAPIICKEAAPKSSESTKEYFQVGDSVTVFPSKEIGIVYRMANEKGDLTVQIKGDKHVINHTRLKLLASASALYPPDYDFSILFDSVANRKARHKMEKQYQEDLEIHYESD